MSTSDEPKHQHLTHQRTPSDGPLGGLLNHIPLQSRFAVTAGVVIGVIASVFAGGMDDLAGQIALGIGVGAGVIAAVVLAIQAKRK